MPLPVEIVLRFIGQASPYLGFADAGIPAVRHEDVKQCPFRRSGVAEVPFGFERIPARPPISQSACAGLTVSMRSCPVRPHVEPRLGRRDHHAPPRPGPGRRPWHPPRHWLSEQARTPSPRCEIQKESIRAVGAYPRERYGYGKWNSHAPGSFPENAPPARVRALRQHIWEEGSNFVRFGHKPPAVSDPHCHRESVTPWTDLHGAPLDVRGLNLQTWAVPALSEAAT